MGARLDDGDEVEVQGSSGVYTLSRNGDVYMCSCSAWRDQGAALDRRTCEHLRTYLGDAEETTRVSAVKAKKPNTDTRPTKIDRPITPGVIAMVADKVERDPRAPVQDPRPATLFVTLPPKAQPKPQPAQAEQKSLYRERLEHEDGKFWEIEVRGSSHITRFGTIGTSGQIRMVDSGTPAAAKAEAEKRAAQKKKEGYRAAKSSSDT